MKKIFMLLVATTLILCGCLHEENQSHSSLSNSSDFNTENTVSGDIDVSSQIIDNSSEPENNPKEITESFMKKCNRSLGGYALFNGTHWFYNSFDDVNGLYKCDADGKNVVCIENFESAQRLMLESTEDAVFYVKTSLLETPIEIGEYEIPFYKELCSYSDDNVKVISSENILDYEISGENIYYTSCDLKIYRIKLDGTQKEVIGEIPYPMDLQIVNEKIFTHSNEAVYEMDLNGNVTNIYNLSHYSLAFNGNEIYYISLSDMSLRYTEDYGETSLKLADSVIGFCIFEDKLIYEKSGTNEIFISDLDGNNYRKIGNGSYPTVVNDRLLCVYDNQIVSLNVQ